MTLINAIPSSTARRILVVDDNPAIHEDFRKTLQSQGADALADLKGALFGDDGSSSQGETPQFEIESAFQGQEGLAMVEKAVRENRPYSLAFVDMRMPPGWDGLQTIKRFWETDEHLEVVICTVQFVAVTDSGHLTRGSGQLQGLMCPT